MPEPFIGIPPVGIGSGTGIGPGSFALGVVPGEVHRAPAPPPPRWEIGEESLRAHWKVHIANAPLWWFRCAFGLCGIDHLLEIGFADDLECVINRYKPAHTAVVFDYSGMESGGEFAGLP